MKHFSFQTDLVVVRFHGRRPPRHGRYKRMLPQIHRSVVSTHQALPREERIL
jgi:hypothetical protein